MPGQSLRVMCGGTASFNSQEPQCTILLQFQYLEGMREGEKEGREDGGKGEGGREGRGGKEEKQIGKEGQKGRRRNTSLGREAGQASCSMRLSDKRSIDKVTV